MKRKLSDNEEMPDVSHLLFNKTKHFVENLNPEIDNELDPDLKPAWVDEDDDNFQANNIMPNVNSKALYTEKLKQKYETLMGTPTWASLSKRNKVEDEQDEILRTVGHLHKQKSQHLPKGILQMKRLPQINGATRNEGIIISCIEFHPKVGAALVAGSSGTVSLFSVGGDVNDKIHSFHLRNWKIHTAQFTPDGSEVLIGSKNNNTYCSYNLVKAEPKLIQLPRDMRKPVILLVSPDGKYIATSDGFEEVFLMCTSSKELLASFKHNSNVVSLSYSHDCKHLYSFNAGGQITVWDLLTYKPLKKFNDHACVTASCLTTSPCGKLLATGTGEGIVNIYKTDELTSSNPIPFKVMSNLTTKVDTLKFNATTEILAASSSFHLNSAKLMHIPSYHVFPNFPMQPNTNINRVNTISFSPNSGYMAMGNNKGSAYLYRLKYYKNY